MTTWKQEMLAHLKSVRDLQTNEHIPLNLPFMFFNSFYGIARLIGVTAYLKPTPLWPAGDNQPSIIRHSHPLQAMIFSALIDKHIFGWASFSRSHCVRGPKRHFGGKINGDIDRRPTERVDIKQSTFGIPASWFGLSSSFNFWYLSHFPLVLTYMPT